MRLTKQSVLVVLGASVAMAGGDATAQSIVVENGPATNNTIPLEPNSNVTVDPTTGNLRVRCDTGTGTVCQPLAGVGGEPVPNAPTSSFTRTDTDTDVRTGEIVEFSWSSNLAKACSATSSGPNGFAQFNGVKEPAGNASFQLNTVGTYEFTFQCYNAAGGSPSETREVVVAQADTPPPPPPPAGCTLGADPQLAPAGWNRVDKAWNFAFSPPNAPGTAVYPNSPGQLIPLGAPRGGYTAISFVPNANQTVQIAWVEAQAYQGTGYNSPRPVTAMFVGISPCPGDLRMTRAGSEANDVFVQRGCRKVGFEDTVVYSTTTGPHNPDTVCALEAGRTYYINVLAANPDDGLSPGESTCINANHTVCDVGARSQAY